VITRSSPQLSTLDSAYRDAPELHERIAMAAKENDAEAK
jgi:hypothetical protein